MSSRKFRFVSPGVFLREIDNSQLPAQADAVGPVIIGRANKGPALKPYKVRSLEELETVFGSPSPGSAIDPWRDGTGLLAETHAMHAAKAYLTAGQGTDSPVTIIRLLGVADENAKADTDGEPGWSTENAWGVFLAEEKNASYGADQTINLDLGAVFYGAATFQPKLEGHNVATAGATVAGGVDESLVRFTDEKLRLTLHDSAGSRKRPVRAIFKDLRKEINTNPVLTNDRISEIIAGSLSEKYWLGESFEEVFKKFESTLASTSKKTAVVLKLASGAGNMSDFKSGKHGAFAGRSGWVVSQDTTQDAEAFDIDSQTKLFRVLALHEGQQASQELIIGIEDIKVPRAGAFDPYGSFSVVVRKITSSGLVELERFSSCNLDPSSQNFVARQIGDQILEWDGTEKRNKLYGEHPNASSHIRIEMHKGVQNGLINKAHVPFGFYGPVRPADITGTVSLNGAAAETMVLQIAPAVDRANLHGTTITVIKENGSAANTPREFTFNKDVTKEAAGALVIGISNVANNPQAMVTAINTKLDADASLDGITFTPSTNGGGAAETITMTQGTAGNVVTVATAAPALTTSTTTPGTDGVINTTPAIASWVTDTLNLTNVGVVGTTYNLSWPSIPLINTAAAATDYTFGVSPYQMTYDSAGLSTAGTLIDPGYIDFLRRLPTYDSAVLSGDQEKGTITAGKTKYSFKFSLDEVILKPVTGKTAGTLTGRGDITAAVYKPGSFIEASSGDSRSYAGDVANATSGCSLRRLLDIVGGFQMPLDGGFDGVNIIESDPFNEEILKSNSPEESYSFASVDRAIELIRDPEAIEHNLAAMPGISNRVLTRKLVEKCEARADSLAIIDLPKIYIAASENKKDTFKDRLTTTPEDAAAELVAEQLNSSYGAAYYPWVKVKDIDSDRDVWAPPSVVALGVMANTEKSSEVWFAPAGFNRGGLNSGNAGIPVLQVTEQLLSKDRDTLYQANINPIASFVSEGIVIFGQKTLQSTASALDRINVRRLLIHVKKEVSRISRNLLFEQNVQATWARFHGQVKPFLESIKARFGLSDFKVVLDSTTTTADLIDRNIMYAKVFLKPARAIEFIAVDFVITRSGASFSDPLE